ncbi:unnamed protein product [Microthlaspi erraticum]|uniref:Uncharacterized protein n=1 Tax=Microthlaspi erraticum TaxID=1685480 RepID=A0A6D2JQI5_9BRAS|nr:unnamed protein product [Microthlaspi erraticum]
MNAELRTKYPETVRGAENERSPLSVSIQASPTRLGAAFQTYEKPPGGMNSRALFWLQSAGSRQVGAEPIHCCFLGCCTCFCSWVGNENCLARLRPGPLVVPFQQIWTFLDKTSNAKVVTWGVEMKKMNYLSFGPS